MTESWFLSGPLSEEDRPPVKNGGRRETDRKEKGFSLWVLGWKVASGTGHGSQLEMDMGEDAGALDVGDS